MEITIGEVSPNQGLFAADGVDLSPVLEDQGLTLMVQLCCLMSSDVG